MRSYTIKIIEKWLLGLVMICLMIAFSVVDVSAASYSDPVDVKVQYTHAYDADADRKNDTFTYQIAPVKGAPAPQGSKNGVYYFKVKGKPGNKPVSGEVDLKIVFPKPGEYQYKVSAYVPNAKKGFNYETKAYTLHVYVKNASNGGLATATVSGEKGYKSGVLKFNPGHESKEVPEEESRPITTPTGDGAGNTPTAVTTTAPGQPAPAVTSEPEEEEAEPAPQTPAQEIINNIVPKADPERDYWSLFNLLAAIATVLAMALLLVRYFGRIDTDDDEYIIRREGKLRLLGIIPAVVSIVTFILTEDLSLPMGWWDEWSLFMLIVLLIDAALILLVYFKYDRDDSEDDGQSAEGVPA